jgi:hypothetical protein
VLNCNIRGPDPERQNDAAVELGVALAAWHALQGHVCSSWEVAEGKVGPTPSRMIQVGAEFETDGFALFRSRFAELAVSRKGAGTKLRRKKPPREPLPIFEYVDYAPGASSPPLWYSPDVSPGPKRPLSLRRQGLLRPCNSKARTSTPAHPSYEVTRERGKESGSTVPPRTQRLLPDRSHGSFLPAYYHLVPLPDG